MFQYHLRALTEDVAVSLVNSVMELKMLTASEFLYTDENSSLNYSATAEVQYHTAPSGIILRTKKSEICSF